MVGTSAQWRLSIAGTSIVGMHKAVTNKCTITIIMVLYLSAVGLIGCSETEDPSIGASPTTEIDPATSDSSENSKISYLRLVATHMHAKDGGTTETGSSVAPNLVERQFSSIDWTKPASHGVNFDADTSLTIKCSPAENDVERHMVAVWRRTENEIKDVSVCVAQYSEPFQNTSAIACTVAVVCERH